MRKGLLYFDVTVLRFVNLIRHNRDKGKLGGNFVGCICSTLWVHIILLKLQYEKLAGVYIRICLSQRGTHYELSAKIGILMVQAVIWKIAFQQFLMLKIILLCHILIISVDISYRLLNHNNVSVAVSLWGTYNAFPQVMRETER